MMCLLKLDQSGEIAGWVIGTDAHDLRRRLDPFDPRSHEIASWLYRTEFVPPGKHMLPFDFILLVT